MEASKTNKGQNHMNMEALKSDVASFAATIGLSSAATENSGFNDIDFRSKDHPIPSGSSKTKRPVHSKNLQGKRPISGARDKKHVTTDPRMGSSSVFNKNEKAESKPEAVVSSRKFPLMKSGELLGPWYTDAYDLELKIFGVEGKRNEVRDLDDAKRLSNEKKKIAERLMEQYSKDYEGSRAKSGDMRMVVMAQKSGTAADKVAAFTCMVEDNPIANMRSLDHLLVMVTSKVGKRHALTGFQALRDLFILKLLPDRKLKYLLQRPVNNLPETKDGFSLLLFWYWEECLKIRYEKFIAAVEDASRDPLPVLKDKALTTLVTLLQSKSEQEHRLLSTLVNKLGDPVRKAASAAAYHLTSLLSVHPSMKAVVIEEVDGFLFRPHLPLRAKCYAANFLNQIRLTEEGDGPKLAKRLVDIYFAVFKVIMAEEGKIHEQNKKEKKSTVKCGHKGESDLDPYIEVDSRLLSALLTGVNRAFPYVGSSDADSIMEVQMPILFKLVHSRNFNIGVQALLLLYQVSMRSQIASDRFYRALYSKLLVPAAMNSSKTEMFLALLVKAMKNDLNLRRVCAFSKRLLQLALQQQPQYACGCLFIISEVLKAKPPLWGMMLQNESVDEELEHFEDISDDSEDGLCTRSPFEDESMTKKINENVSLNDNSLWKKRKGASAACLLGNQGLSEKNPNMHMVVQRERDDSQNHFRESPRASETPGVYMPRCRDPSYCNADHAGWWELVILSSHTHPSVATMAGTLLSGANIIYNGDPLNDLSLTAFLDKFMEKKSKLNRRADGLWYGGSQIAPARKLDASNQVVGAEMLSLAEHDVAPEDMVFHKFYMNKMTSTKKPPKKKDTSSDAEELINIGTDESENEAVDDMFGLSGDAALDEDDYSYEDLEKFAEDEDDVLVSGAHAAELSATLRHDQDDFPVDDSNDDDDDVDDGGMERGSRKRKVQQTMKSPFMSADEYEKLYGGDHSPVQSNAAFPRGKRHRGKK